MAEVAWEALLESAFEMWGVRSCKDKRGIGRKRLRSQEDQNTSAKDMEMAKSDTRRQESPVLEGRCEPGEAEAGADEGFTKEWEEEMMGYGYTWAQVEKMKRGEWDETDADKALQVENSQRESSDVNECQGRRDTEVSYAVESDVSAGTGHGGAVTLAFEDWESLSRETFWDVYMLPNKPVVVKGYVAHCPQHLHFQGADGVVGEGGSEEFDGASQVDGEKEKERDGCERGWRAWREWLTKDGAVDTKHLRQLFGHVCVTVHNCAQVVRGMVCSNAVAWLLQHASHTTNHPHIHFRIHNLNALMLALNVCVYRSQS